VVVRAVAAAAVLAALAGCGGDTRTDGIPAKRPPPATITPNMRGPAPKEPLDRAVDRVRAVIKDQDCRALLALYHPDVGAPPRSTCPGTLRSLRRASVTDSQRFDSAAVVRLQLGNHSVLELVEALDRAGRFRVVSLGGKAPEQVAPSEETDRYAAAALGAIRAGNCRDLAAYYARYEPGAATPAQICALLNVRRLRAELHPGDRQRLGRLGGDGAAAFYVARVAGRGAYTVILLANTPGDYRFAYAVRSG
jgi:hypothetical protein